MKNQIVVLAAGKSSRFYPFNKGHKSFFSIVGKPLLLHTLEGINKLAVTDIVLVLNEENRHIGDEMLKDTSVGGKVRVVYQKEPLGQGDSILATRKFIKGNFFVLNAQQFNFRFQKEFLTLGESKNEFTAVLGTRSTDEPWKYGVLKLEKNKVLGIVEKPEMGKEPSKVRISGMYFFKPNFFEELEKTNVSEYSLEETLDHLSKSGRVGKVDLEKETPSLKYPWDLLEIKNYFIGDLKREFCQGSRVSDTATIRGDVYIGRGAVIYDYAVIDGPAYIGDKAVVGAFCHVRGGSVIEESAELQHYVDFKNSIIGNCSTVHSGFVGDSVIGKNVKIGAGFITANKRLDRANVNVLVKNNNINSNLRGLGVIIGDNTKIGVCVSTMPGTVLGEGCTVYPNQKLSGTYEHKSRIK